MNLNELKQVELNNVDNVSEHAESVLTLKKDEIREYLEFALDTFYSDDSKENSETVIDFFNIEKFKPFYEEMYNSVNVKSDKIDSENEVDSDVNETE